MALIERGPARLGETLAFPVAADRTIRAEIVDPVVLDKENTRQDV
jgi:butyrate kinase